MIALSQVSNISELVTRQYKLFSATLGIVTLKDYTPGSTWSCHAVSTDDPALSTYLAEDELFAIEAGDTVVVRDEDGINYVGFVTRVSDHSVTAKFGKRTYKFAPEYITHVVAAGQTAQIAVA